ERIAAGGGPDWTLARAFGRSVAGLGRTAQCGAEELIDGFGSADARTGDAAPRHGADRPRSRAGGEALRACERVQCAGDEPACARTAVETARAAAGCGPTQSLREVPDQPLKRRATKCPVIGTDGRLSLGEQSAPYRRLKARIGVLNRAAKRTIVTY